jgi:uracil-DNA glycosylase family 4
MRVGEIINPAAEIASLLSWWQEAGVDVLIDEESRNWLAPAKRATAPVAHKAAVAPLAKATTTELPAGLADFQTWLATSDDIPVPVAARIAPTGDIASGLMLLSDLPEAEDAESGQIMSGTIGRLFDRMIAAIGRDRASIYLAAMVPGRTAGGYVDPASAALFTRLARHHVNVAQPRVLLLLGEAPARAMLGLGFVEARGRVHTVDLPGGAVRAIASFHPRTLIQHPAQKARAWADLQLLMKTLTA